MMNHVYVEAYKLMLYRDDAGHEEWIWNSRDGVVPFIVRTRQGHEAQHVEWKRDRYLPRHVPAVGDRIFVTMTPDRAVEFATRWLERCREYSSTSEEMQAHFQERYPDERRAIAERALELLKEFFPSPDLVEVTQEMHEQFRKLAPPLSAWGAIVPPFEFKAAQAELERKQLLAEAKEQVRAAEAALTNRSEDEKNTGRNLGER